jgi:N-acetylmuramoyl-L-alanine amidase
MIDGREIATDVPPVIINGRTLAPARAVFEALGGDVYWDEAASPAVVRVSYSGISLTLTIGSATATVNGAEAIMDEPARILNDRTLIPARFVSESLNFTVRWDEANKIVNIYSPGFPIPVEISWINDISVSASESGTRVIITGTTGMYDISQWSQPETRQLHVEIPNSVVTASTGALEWQREISAVRGVSAADAGENRARLTFDLLEDVPPLITNYPEQKTIHIDFPKPANPFVPWADGKLSVILDPGHGAETSGKRSPDGSLLEYAFNRDMAARIKPHLERHSIEVLLTTDGDYDTSLADRCAIANNSGADVFISIHANASGARGWSSASGWETYVYKKGSYSEILAEAIHAQVIPASGLVDRGVKAERYYVIRNVNMPAALIEHGFYTNKTEVELLKSPEFRERLAVMDAKGIVSFLGLSWIEG